MLTGIDPKKVSVVYNGVDLKHIAAENSSDNSFADADWAGATHIITCVANIRRVKGIDVLIMDGTTCLPRNCPMPVFVVAGSLYERDYSEEIREMIQLTGTGEKR